MSYRAEKDKTHFLSLVYSISNIMPRHWIVIIADWIHLLSSFLCSSRLSACSQKCLRLICTSLASPTTSLGTVSLLSLPLWKESVTSMENPPHFLAWTTHRGFGMSSDQRRKRLRGSRALSWVLGAAAFSGALTAGLWEISCPPMLLTVPSRLFCLSSSVFPMWAQIEI